MIYYATIGVAHHRPPKIDEYRRYAVEAPEGTQALLLAAQMASCTSVMPVWGELVGDEEVGT